MISPSLCGLSPEVQVQLLAVFKKHSHIKKVILYGSRAKGLFKSSSDIDLTLDAPQLDYIEFTKVVNEVDDLLLPYKVDLSIYNQLNNNYLILEIDQFGIELK